MPAYFIWAPGMSLPAEDTTSIVCSSLPGFPAQQMRRQHYKIWERRLDYKRSDDNSDIPLFYYWQDQYIDIAKKSPGVKLNSF